MWAVAGIVVAATATSATSDTTTRVYRVAAIALVVLAALTVLTGARTRVIWFKICPVLLTASAVLLLIASAACQVFGIALDLCPSRPKLSSRKLRAAAARAGSAARGQW